jgi:hypothetical protein
MVCVETVEEWFCSTVRKTMETVSIQFNGGLLWTGCEVERGAVDKRRKEEDICEPLQKNFEPYANRYIIFFIYTIGRRRRTEVRTGMAEDVKANHKSTHKAIYCRYWGVLGGTGGTLPSIGREGDFPDLEEELQAHIGNSFQHTHTIPQQCLLTKRYFCYFLFEALLV